MTAAPPERRDALGISPSAPAPTPSGAGAFTPPGVKGPDSPTDGIHPNTPEAVYRAWPCVNQSLLQRGLPSRYRGGSPAHMLHYLRTPTEPTDAMELGTALHAALLEPDLFTDKVTVLTETRGRRSNDDKAWWAEVEAANAGKVILTPDEWGRVVGMVKRLRAHPKLRRVLNTTGENEAAAVWTDPETGLQCKARIDRFVPKVALLDVKTSRNASPEGFAKSMLDFGYHRQAAFYEWGYQVVTGEATPMVFAVVESEAPFEPALHMPDEDAIAVARMQNAAVLRRYARAVETNQWEGYGRSVHPASVPKWEKDAWLSEGGH